MTDRSLTCAYSGLRSVASFEIEQEPSDTTPTPVKEVIYSDEDRDRIIQMAWEDRTPFEAIEFQFGLKEKSVIDFMRAHSLPSSFRMWRKRMKARTTKHAALRNAAVDRFKCSRQRETGNTIAKR